VSGTITGPADELALEAANPIAFAYGWLLNRPCMFKPTEEQKDECPQPLYSGPFQLGLSPGWFEPQTTTFRYWAMREAGTCAVKYRPPWQTEENGCHSDQQRCSPTTTLTLPATVAVRCEPSASAARHHHHNRHRR
jgi:hypothetical protein